MESTTSNNNAKNGSEIKDPEKREFYGI